MCVFGSYDHVPRAVGSIIYELWAHILAHKLRKSIRWVTSSVRKRAFEKQWSKDLYEVNL